MLLAFNGEAWGNIQATQQQIDNTMVSLHFTNASIQEIANEIKRQTNIGFAINDTDNKTALASLSIEANRISVKDALDRLLRNSEYVYQVTANHVVIKRRENTPQQPQRAQRQVIVQGRVVDAEGLPIVGVAVVVKAENGTRGTATGADGRYMIPVAPEEVLVFSFVGKKMVEVAYTGQQTIDVRMEDETTDIDQVVITGMFDRRLESATGSSAQFTGEQLRNVGNQNVLRSLANLDPSFMIMESLEFGSDPNAMPTIQMRGQSSFPDLEGEYAGNPNQPLFILDGFETTVERIYDLDMNRVSSVTILKDASAKAIYGSKAGNGVVIITTVRPQPGKLRVSYSGKIDIEAPDLTGYNLMNAREKFEFENKLGVYASTNINDVRLATARDAVVANIASGVDTHWLSQPLRTGVGQTHALDVEGGDNSVVYRIGVNYNNVAGVMKGSERNTLSGNMYFSYTYKNMIFRNTLEIILNDAANSPYGNFSEYARLQPYWRPYDDNGEPIPNWTFRGNINTPHANPLYNATLNTLNTSKYTTINDNFQMEWRILDNLRATGRFSFTRRTAGTDVFYPSNHTMFLNYTSADANRRGRYTKGESEDTTYQADAGLSYSKSFGNHIIAANANWNMRASTSSNYTTIGEGFGEGSKADLAFAMQYPIGSRPNGGSNNQREIGVVGALNYSYADRYLFDTSVRTSGSSMFGAENKWGLFWSLGAGWNIHNEAFAQDAQWLNFFKVRGSVGFTGSQNFDPYQAKAVYEYSDMVYDSRFGGILMGLPNPRLRWQRMLDYNIGTNIALWDSRINIAFDYFISITDDLLIDVALPPSIGFSTYKENLGKVENKGFELTVGVTPWRNREKNAWLTVSLSAMHNKNTLKEVSDTFEHRNNEQNREKDSYGGNSGYFIYPDQGLSPLTYARPSTLYYEGQSMDAIWGVRSAGISPMTGREIYYDLDGNIVSQWSSLNQIILGNAAPTMRGNINLSAGYKGFTLNVACAYRFGGEMYNSTLIEKVEYADPRYNMDRRAVDAWMEVGQMAKYARYAGFSGSGPSIRVNVDPSRPTSRFVMKDNELYVQSLSLGYDFRGREFLTKLGMENLRLSFNMNELLRLSSIEIERGTSYPFARNFSLSLNATF